MADYITEILKISELAGQIVLGNKSATILRACSKEIRAIIAPDYPPVYSRGDKSAVVFREKKSHPTITRGGFSYSRANAIGVVLRDDKKFYHFHCACSRKKPPTAEFIIYDTTEVTVVRHILQEIFGKEISFSVKYGRICYLTVAKR